MSPSSDPPDIVEARALVLRHSRSRVATVLTPLAFSVAILGSVYAGIQEQTVIPLMIAMFAGLGVNLVRHLPLKDRAAAAQRKLDAWDAQKEPVADDPRFLAAQALIRRIGELGIEVEGVGPIAVQAEERLRGRIEDLRLLDQAVAVDRALGDDQRQQGLRAVRDRKEAEIVGLLDRLRDLHAGLAVRQAGGDVEADLGELVGRLSAEAAADAEVDAVDARREAVRRAARSRQSQ